MAKKKDKEQPRSNVTPLRPSPTGNVIGERHGITLLAMQADNFSGVTAHIRAQSHNSAVWRVFRRHEVNGSTGQAYAYYYIEDLRGWKVGHALTLSSLYEILAKADKSMGQLWKQEHKEETETMMAAKAKQ